MALEPTQIVAAVNVGAAVARNQKPIVSFVQRAWNTWWRRTPGPEKILLAGTGGSGKSTLLAFLTGKGETATAKYKQTNVIERGSLTREVFGTIWSLPGQDNPFSIGTASPNSAFVADKIKHTTGIIVVCCYGYNAVASIPKGEPPQDTRTRLLHSEGEIFDSLAKVCGQFERLRWIVLALNKRDIWLADEAACEAHYDEAIERLRAELTASGRGGSVSVTRKAVSLISSNVRLTNGTILYRIDPNYDDFTRQDDVEDFLNAAAEVSGARV